MRCCWAGAGRSISSAALAERKRQRTCSRLRLDHGLKRGALRAQGRAIAHDAYGVDDSASFADSAFSVGTSLIEQESTLAEYADHGRGCHSPKYMAARAEPGEYGHREGAVLSCCPGMPPGDSNTL